MFLDNKKLSDILVRKNVNQVFFGKKIKSGKNTGESAIVVGVSRKEEKKELQPMDLIPDFIEGVKTDVVVLPMMEKQGSCNSLDIDTSNACEGHAVPLQKGKEKCILNGSSIGFSDYSFSSTLGLPLFDNEKKSIAGVSCNHAVSGGVIYNPTKASPVSYFIDREADGKSSFAQWNTRTLSLEEKLLNPTFDQDFGDTKRFEAGRSYNFIGSPNLSNENSELVIARDYGILVFLDVDAIFYLTGLKVSQGDYFLGISETTTVFNQPQVNYKIYKPELIYDTFFFASDLYSSKGFDVKKGLFDNEEDFLLYFLDKDFQFCFELAESEITLEDEGGDLLYDSSSKISIKDRPIPSLRSGETMHLKIDPSGSNYSSSGLYYFLLSDESKSNTSLISFKGRIEYLYFGEPDCFKENGKVLDIHQQLSNHKAYYPSIPDASSEESHFIGEATVHPLSFYHPLNYNEYSGNIFSYNTVDLALIDFLKEVMPTSHFIDLYTGKIKIAEPILGARIFKSGRTTGATSLSKLEYSGYITALDWSGSVSYCPENTTNSHAFFKDCVAYSSESDILFNYYGDSGSAIFMEKEGEMFLIGIHFAGGKILNSSVGVAYKISNLLELHPNLKTWNGDYELLNVNNTTDVNAYKICEDCYYKVESDNLPAESNFYKTYFKNDIHKEYDSAEECS